MVSNLAEKQYFITSIDDYSRKLWIYFPLTNTRRLISSRNGKQKLRLRMGKKLECLRTDNILEYCNKRFNEFCKGAGVKRHQTCVYTPQHKGVSKSALGYHGKGQMYVN